MTKVTFIIADRQQAIEAEDNVSLMENARRASVKGIVAECGGACSCATCHVHVAQEWVAAVGGPEPMERDMLDFASNLQSNSRLSCQINVTPSLDGLVVHIPGE